MSFKEARVGVGVFVFNQTGHFLVGERKGSVGAGTWALAGGHLDFGESFEECARRETLEETGLDIGNVRFLTAVNSVLETENRHYVTIFMIGEVQGDKQEPELMEPDKCDKWIWITWREMKELATDQLKMHKRQGKANRQVGNQGVAELEMNNDFLHDSTRRQLFVPLLNLIRDRPDVVPGILPN